MTGETVWHTGKKSLVSRLVDIGIVIGLVGISLIALVSWWKIAPKTEFEEEPLWEEIPIQPPVIAPIVPPVMPGTPTLSGVNLLSGACPTLQYNILKDIVMITPAGLFHYVEPEPKRYITSALRIGIYYKNSLKDAPGVFGCKLTFADVKAYVSYLGNNPDAGLKPDVAKSARMVYPYLKEA